MPRSSPKLRTAFFGVAAAALTLSACVSQSVYDELETQHQQLEAQNRQLQGQLATLQAKANFIEAGDLLFPPGGYQLSPAGKSELAANVAPRLRGLPYATVVVYGYTDNAPVGPELRRAGINDNLTLSLWRAAAVANFLISQGVDPRIISIKGFGDTHPVVPNDTPANRAKNRRIVITVQGPGAPGA